MSDAANNVETAYFGNHHNVEKNVNFFVGIVMIGIKQKKKILYNKIKKIFLKLASLQT